MLLGPFGCITTLSAKRAKLVQKFVPRSRIGISLKNAPDPPHWTLNRSFGAFHTTWVYLGPFGCVTIIGAKRAELVQKSMQRSRVEIFRTERIRSTPLYPKLVFWYV